MRPYAASTQHPAFLLDRRPKYQRFHRTHKLPSPGIRFMQREDHARARAEGRRQVAAELEAFRAAQAEGSIHLNGRVEYLDHNELPADDYHWMSDLAEKCVWCGTWHDGRHFCADEVANDDAILADDYGYEDWDYTSERLSYFEVLDDVMSDCDESVVIHGERRYLGPDGYKLSDDLWTEHESEVYINREPPWLDMCEEWSAQEVYERTGKMLPWEGYWYERSY